MTESTVPVNKTDVVKSELPRSSDVLAALEAFALSETKGGAAIAEFLALHGMIFTEDGRPNPRISAADIEALVSHEIPGLQEALAMLDRVTVPNLRGMPMFRGCYTFLAADKETGKPCLFAEKPNGGLVFKMSPHSVQYALRQMASMLLLEKIDYDPSLAANMEVVTKILGKPEGSVHIGGIVAMLPVGENGERKWTVLGVSGAELTEGAVVTLTMILQHPESIDPFPSKEQRAELPRSVLHMPYGFFTAAGYFDAVAGQILEAALGGADLARCQEIADGRWNSLLAWEKISPLKGRVH